VRYLRLGLLGAVLLAGWVVGCQRSRPRALPSASIPAAWEKFRLGEFAGARRDFEAAARAAPQGSSDRLAALYGLAATWNLQQPGADFAQAERLYREVIALAATNDWAAWSRLALARMKSLPVAGEIPPLPLQIEAYQEVIDRFPFHPAGEEAFLMQQAARLQQPDDARTRDVLEALRTFLRTHPQSPWRSAAYGLAGHCSAVLGLKDERMDAAFQSWRTAEIDPANPAQDLSWTYWNIATLAEFETGDFALAREYYRKLIAEYPTEQRVFLAKQELKRMDELEVRIRGEASGVREQESGMP
jgi:tetratricopeptide (TPR) repeat protein